MIAGSRTAGEQRDPGSDVIAIVRSIRHWSTSEYTRITIDLDVETRYKRFMLTNPARLYFDIHGSKLSPGLGSKPYLVNDEHVKQIRISQNRAAVVRVVLDLTKMKDYSVSELPTRSGSYRHSRAAERRSRIQGEPSGRKSSDSSKAQKRLLPASARSVKPGGAGTQPDSGPQAMPAVVRQHPNRGTQGCGFTGSACQREIESGRACRSRPSRSGRAIASKSQLPGTHSVSPQGDSVRDALLLRNRPRRPCARFLPPSNKKGQPSRVRQLPRTLDQRRRRRN